MLASVSASPAYETRGPESVPSTQRVPLTTGVLDDPSASSSSSTQPPLLKFYRDTNAWCPFCERVWLALEAKQIPYECEFVDLRNKPKWFTDMVPTGLVPAARFNSDDALVWESADILRELEERFPDVKLTPDDEEATQYMNDFIEKEVEAKDTLTAIGYRYLIGGAFGEERDPSKLPELKEALDEAVERAKPYFDHGFIAGNQVSLADVMIAPAIERLAANLVTFRGYDLREKLAPWFDAMEELPAYGAVMGDPETHNTVVRQLFGLKKDEAHLPPPPQYIPVTPGGAEEAGQCLKNNLDAVVADAVKNSGVSEEDADVVRVYLQTLADSLNFSSFLDSDGVGSVRPMSPHPRPSMQELKELDDEAAEAAVKLAARKRAVGAATIAFVRNRVSAPRDMSAHAAVAFRAAADSFLTSIY